MDTHLKTVMSQSSITHLTMRECIDTKQENIVTIASLVQNRPTVKQIGSSICKIHSHMMKDATYPSNTVLNRCLHQRLQELSRNGLFFVSKNLFICGGFSQQKASPQPADSILDVCMIVENMPVTILTLVQDNSEHVDETDTYCLTLAREVTVGIRSYCKEHVTVLYGVVTERDINTTDNFQGFLKRLIEQNQKRYIPESLKMPNEKWKCITRAFAASIAITSSVFCDNTESLYFLTYEQFCILIENIDKKDVTVRTAPSSGGRTLIREVARRLEISGPTLLVMETEDQIQIARGMDTCSFTATLEEWKKKLEAGTWSMGVINMVTNCQDCPPVPGLSGKSWTFIPDLHKLKEENEALRMIKKDLTSGLESVSLGRFSMDSGVGSNYSTFSSVASGGANPEQLASPEKHIGGLKVLKNLKKKLTSESFKSKKQARKIPAYLLDNTAVYILTNHVNHSPIFLICQTLAIDQPCCHVTSDDEHVELHQGMCRTLQTSFSAVPHANTHTRAQYWETESDIELKGLGVLMEIGVTGASSEEMSSVIHKQANTWSIMVTACAIHSGICTQVWLEGKHERCCQDTMPLEQVKKVTLRHGVIVDENGTVGFFDINRNCLLYKCHTLIREDFCQVFGVGTPLYNNPGKMKLIRGNMIAITDEKQRLIYAALTNSSDDSREQINSRWFVSL
ncbi:uncharacterized protein LOC124145964 isoform X2 [Haliotis rufescens]|uniref:uncharacterized protein LOC124145964 isoform X2 n=1 Tax=Haliotis rufescens TaxID=6454 RepID=UPI001EB07B0D|nr:uncharacterized protein LOC124145964 isoform X2 [Haliotis rufescens]